MVVMPKVPISDCVNTQHQPRLELGESSFEFALELFLIAGLAFPHCEHSPADLPQMSGVASISFRISRSLCVPELGICLRSDSAESTLVHVPEATVNEDDGPMLWENDVRASRQIADVQPVPISERVEKSSDLHLRAGVLPLDA